MELNAIGMNNVKLIGIYLCGIEWNWIFVLTGIGIDFFKGIGKKELTPNSTRTRENIQL